MHYGTTKIFRLRAFDDDKKRENCFVLLAAKISNFYQILNILPGQTCKRNGDKQGKGAMSSSSHCQPTRVHCGTKAFPIDLQPLLSCTARVDSLPLNFSVSIPPFHSIPRPISWYSLCYPNCRTVAGSLTTWPAQVNFFFFI